MKKIDTHQRHLQVHRLILEKLNMERTVDMKIKPKTLLDRLTINLKGGVWIGLFTFLMLAGCVNAMFLDGKDIPEGVRWIYATVLGAFAGTKITGKLMNGKNGQPVEED
jgi:hypothetical protein